MKTYVAENDNVLILVVDKKDALSVQNEEDEVKEQHPINFKHFDPSKLTSEDKPVFVTLAKLLTTVLNTNT